MAELNLESKFAGKAEIPIILGDEKGTHLTPKVKYYAWEQESFSGTKHFSTENWTKVSTFNTPTDPISLFKIVYVAVQVADYTLLVFNPETDKEYDFVNESKNNFSWKLKITKDANDFFLHLYPYYENGNQTSITAYVPTVIGVVERIG